MAAFPLIGDSESGSAPVFMLLVQRIQNKTQILGTTILVITTMLALTSCTFTAKLSKKLHPPSGKGYLPDGDYRDINATAPGEEIDVRKYVVYRKYTIMDFYSRYCGPCEQIKEPLMKLTQTRTDIAVRAVDVDRPGSDRIDWGSPVLKEYGIHSIPAFKIFGPHGDLIADGSPARDEVRECLAKEGD